MDPLHPSLGWLAAFTIIFLSTFAWLALFGRRTQGSLWASLRVHLPLTTLSIATSIAIYLSDTFNHQVANFLQPTAPLLLVLALLSTAVVQNAAFLNPSAPIRSLGRAIEESARWAIPASLVLLGLVQGGSYLWMIGNDFTRYWNIADAVRSWAGYPGMVTLPDFAAIGEPRYTIDLPLFGVVLMPSFALFGHDTFAAYLPNLAANAVLPLLLYDFYRGAGISRPIAFAGSCALTTMPFLRLYTLNAPLPDTLFLALLVAAAAVYERLASKQASEKREARSEENPPLPLGEGRGEGGPGEGRGTGDDRLKPRPPREERAGDAQGPWRSLAARQEPPALPDTKGESRPQSSALSPQSSLAWLLFGILAALTMLTRPEAPLFLGLMAIGVLPFIVRRGPWISAAVSLLLLLPYSAVMYASYHVIWPNNAGPIFGLKFVGENVHLLQGGLVGRYAEALGMSEGQFVAATLLLGIASVAGTIWLARYRWNLALLPLAGLASTCLVTAVNPTVSGVRLWFDFFRHISYGLPFLSLAPLFFLDRLSRAVAERRKSDNQREPRSTGMRTWAAGLLAVLLIAVSLWQLQLLTHPSQTYRSDGTQLLNSDVWVTIRDLAEHRYELPMLPHARDTQGALLIEHQFDHQYLTRHLDIVRKFFEPYTVIRTNRGAQYEVSSMLLVLFGCVFALASWREKLAEDHRLFDS